MRVVIVDPYLCDQGGHSFFYNFAVKNAIEKRSVESCIVGRIDSDNTCLSEPGYIAALEDVSTTLMNLPQSPKHVWKAMRSFDRTYRALQRTFGPDGTFPLKKNDIIFCPTIVVYDALPFALFFRTQLARLRALNAKLIMFLRWDYSRSMISSSLLRLSHSWLSKNGKGVLAYATDSRLIKAYCEPLLGTEVVVYPIPITPNRIRFEKHPSSGKPNLLYLGCARHNKGFDLVIDLINETVANPEWTHRVDFTVQSYPGRQNWLALKRTVAQMKRLEELSQHTDNVRLIRGNLSEEEYATVLSSGDIMLLPYRPSGYGQNTSNLLIEAVLSGSIPITTQGTWLSHELTLAGLEDLTFDIREPDAFKAAVFRVLTDIEAQRQRIDKLQKEWAHFHTADRLVDILLKQSTCTAL